MAQDNSRSPRLPLKIAKKAVLEAMFANQRRFSYAIPGNPAHSPEGAGGLKPTLDEIKKLNWVNVRFAGDLYSKSPTDPDVHERCLMYGIPNYSDIMAHYYCQIPSIWRGCHRMLLYAFAYEHEAIAAKAPETRDWAIETCTKVDEGDFDRSFVKVFNLQESDLAGHRFILNSYTEAKAARKYFKAMYDAQVVKNDRGEDVNVFDYIMKSQTYAFDWRDQNEVINAFYGAMADPAKGEIWDPTDEKSCKLWRLSRREDSRDAGQNYCDVSVPKSAPILSNLR